MGVDVQTRKRCAYLVLDTGRKSIDQGWLEGDSTKSICRDLVRVITKIEKKDNGLVAVGIDSPRHPLGSPRNHFGDRGRQTWRQRVSSEKGYGRHCEVVLKVLDLANPQWTAIRENCPAWMLLGFALFSCLENRQGSFEVFPAASYCLLNSRTSPEVSSNFSEFAYGPKDMIDACVSAVTVMEFIQGRGCGIGGGDGIGSIILPTPLPVEGDHPVLRWPPE
ncbi:MAG: hypothetical protein ACOZF2_07920 [Thermodesulfobacteriota bacterium]